MKYRVERSRLDHGYGLGWVVLDPQGDVAAWSALWVDALGTALWLCDFWRRRS